MDVRHKATWLFLNWMNIQDFIRDNYLRKIHSDEYNTFESVSGYCPQCGIKSTSPRLIYNKKYDITRISSYDACESCYHVARTKGIHKFIMVKGVRYFLNYYYSILYCPCAVCTDLATSGFSIWDKTSKIGLICENCAMARIIP
jgi:hypothetical protein